MTNKLTLPIEVGKKYVRRDGWVITALAPHPEYAKTPGRLVYVGNEPTAPLVALHHAWIDTGAIHYESGAQADQADLDLVADYIEPEPVDAEVPKGHPHARILRAIADGEQIGVTGVAGSRKFDKVSASEALGYIAEGLESERFGILPRTVTINGHEVPEPLREAPHADAMVWVVMLPLSSIFPPGKIDDGPIRWRFGNLGTSGLGLLAHGLLHSTQEAAELHARALLSFTKAAA